jgi:hypothetical protein
MIKRPSIWLLAAAVVVVGLAVPTMADAANKPNILIIWGDDIGY